jgi:hypothetical protein
MFKGKLANILLVARVEVSRNKKTTSLYHFESIADFINSAVVIGKQWAQSGEGKASANSFESTMEQLLAHGEQLFSAWWPLLVSTEVTHHWCSTTAAAHSVLVVWSRLFRSRLDWIIAFCRAIFASFVFGAAIPKRKRALPKFNLIVCCRETRWYKKLDGFCPLCI